MQTYHILTYCALSEDHPFTDNVMETVSVAIVFNGENPPSKETISGLLHIIAPSLEPLMSEVSEVPYVSRLNGR